MSETGKLIRDILNVKKADYFCSYGLSEKAREVVDYMRGHAEVSAGIAVDNVQFEEADYLKTAIYRGTEELGATRIFDRVYCAYESFPRSQKSIKQAFAASHSLCEVGGLVLLTGLNDWILIAQLMEKHHIKTHWLLREGEVYFDLLYKK